MKINTNKIVFALIFSICFLTIHSQSDEQRRKITGTYDLRTLKEMRTRFSNEFAENHARALELARINNWPIRIEKEDGGVSELQGVTEDGYPLYYTTDNAGSATTSRANKLYLNGGLGLNLTGLGMIAGVWDSSHSATNHLDFITGTQSRVIKYDQADTQPSLHATHVTGTILSSGVRSSSLSGRGIAYESKVWTSEWGDDLTEMADAAAIDGLLLSNHSYGLVWSQIPTSYFGAYISSSKSIDDLIFNAPYYQPVVSAGNDRNDLDQQANPTKGGHDLITKYGTAKNTIVVAAVNQVTSYTGPGSVTMSTFSSWGPTDDNRVKPDISNKGVNVYSTSNFSTSAYVNQNGTSMATPGVTGTLLLLQQHYSNVYSGLEIPYMKNATLRGLMCHTADEAGAFDGPDSRFGWGLINAEKAAQAITKSEVGQSVISELTLNQGETYTKNISVSSGEPLIATIAWTDKGGTVNTSVVDLSTPVLVNNLDIRVTKVGGEVNFPWKLNDVVDSDSVKADNNVDNIEKVEVPGAAGDYVVTVTHKGTLVGGKQDFSLIVTGALSLAAEQNDFKVFNVWPNPANDVLNVSLQSDSFEDSYVSVYDVQGKRVMVQKLNREGDYVDGVLNLGFLNSGMYLLKINQGTKQATKKIVIN